MKVHGLFSRLPREGPGGKSESKMEIGSKQTTQVLMGGLPWQATRTQSRSEPLGKTVEHVSGLFQQRGLETGIFTHQELLPQVESYTRGC